MERSSPAAVGTAAPAGRADQFGGDPLIAGFGETGASAAGHGSAVPGSAHAWKAMGGDSELLARLSCTPRSGLTARLPVQELARASVAVCSLAAAELSAVRSEGAGGGTTQVPAVHVDDGAVAAAFTSERLLRIDGQAPGGFSPLSRFWRTRDGWVRTHANYPHHRDRLLATLGVEDEGRSDDTLERAVAAALAGRHAFEVEETVLAAGGLAVAVRSSQEWTDHPQGAQVGRRPLLSTVRMDQALPRSMPDPDGHGPLHGVRVLDLTRVLAGPVATRTLALLGADVLRIDGPGLPEDPGVHADTGAGKRSAVLDLSCRSGQATFEELLSEADMVVTGYRPGALDRFGLAPESLADRRPGLVVGQLSAWGAYGPWHRRRGFDSLVQAATGVSLIEGRRDESDGDVPGALPAQALDHGTGYLLAAAVMRALTEQRRGQCGARLVRVALAQTADWLTRGLTSHSPSATGTPGGPDSADTDGAEIDEGSLLAETDSPVGRLRYVLPPVGYEGSPRDWPRPAGTPGADPAAWW